MVGVGRIGLCLGLNLERAGYEVLGVDKNRDHVRRLNERSFHSPEPGVEAALGAARALRVCDRLDEVRDFGPALVLVAVDTPPAAVGGYDHSRVDQVIDGLVGMGPAPRRTELVVVCTTLPGYCDSKAAAAGERGYALSYNPGFVAQGSIMRDQQLPRQVLIGQADPTAGDAIERMHRRICLDAPAVHRLSRLDAEIAKLATNCFLTMKIAFANGIGDLATKVGADAQAILAAVGADDRIGAECLQYGFAYGGPCFPRDNRALDHFARQQGHELLQARATDEMNHAHAAFQLAEYLRSHAEDEAIHFNSVTYKPGTEILEESPPLDLAVELARAGRRVVLHDRPAVLAQVRARFGALFEYRDET